MQRDHLTRCRKWTKVVEIMQWKANNNTTFGSCFTFTLNAYLICDLCRRPQFVSPHTGLVYQKHVTGLCQFMQDEVELEVRRAQAFGKLRCGGADFK